MEPLPKGAVGPFWLIEEAGELKVLAVAVPLNEAVRYGDMVTVEAGHYEYWSQLARLGPAGLRAAGLPTAPVWSEYEEWPRGRVIYDTKARQFLLRADRQLHHAPRIARIVAQFGIDADDCLLFADEHYRSTRKIRG